MKNTESQNQDKATAIRALIKLAGINLQQNPTEQAESLLDGLRKIESEHAALVAVAEAAKDVVSMFEQTRLIIPADLSDEIRLFLKQSLANYEAIRNGGEK